MHQSFVTSLPTNNVHPTLSVWGEAASPIRRVTCYNEPEFDKMSFDAILLL